MSATLKEILASVRERVQQARRSADLGKLREKAAQHQPRGFRASLERAGAVAPAVITELKKASPSKGVIRCDFPVAQLARELEAAGAAALSVLTEEKYFHGSLDNLAEASAATRLPCLRKDFILDEFQLLEARAHGADAVLLIVAALEEEQLRKLVAAARELQLDMLCEVHDEAESQQALAAGCDVIGVNSRNLKTFRTDPQVLFRLASKLPSHVLRVAESGLSSGEELRRLSDAGYQAFLIGESLMRAESPGEALRQMITEFKTAGQTVSQAPVRA